MISWSDITGIGDTVVMLPAAAVIGAWLMAARATRMALCWSLMFCGALVCVLATKIAFVGWGIGIRALDLAGISGHAMRAMAVMPVLCYLALRHAPAGWRVSGVLFGLLGGSIISASRLALQLHSVSEVVAGAALGLLVSLGFIFLCRAQRLRQIPRAMMALGLLALVPTSHAEPAPTSRWINGVALYLSGHEHPYDRATWRMAGASGRIPACGSVGLVLRSSASGAGRKK